MKAEIHFHIARELYHKLKKKKNTLKINVFYCEPTTGLEPVTSSLPRKHSTAELSRPKLKNHTGKRDFFERKTGVEPATFSLEG